jgi:putative sterol carrier protein
MLMHVTVHGEYHRGQISLIMMQNSITPPGDGFTSYLHKAEAGARRRPGRSSDTVGTHPDENRLNMAPLAKQGPAETSAKGGIAMSRLAELTESIRAAVGADSGLGKTLKFNLKEEGFIYIEGGSVTNEDKPANLTLTLTIDDLKAISGGKLAPMTAVMSGRLSLSDMGLAAGLQGKLQALFSKMQPVS